MGRTNPTFRDLSRSEEERWDDYRRVLRREDQLHFERSGLDARDHADAAGNLNHEDRLAPILMSICLEQEKRIEELERRMEDYE